MTALCGGGASSPQAGAPAQVAFGAAALDVLLTEAGLVWMIPFLSAYEAKFITLASFCAVDPPAIVAFTPQNLIDLATPLGGGDVTGALAKVDAVVQNLAWYAFCQCNANPQPVQPAPLTAQPANAPVIYIPTPANCGSFPLSNFNLANLGDAVTYEFQWQTPGSNPQLAPVLYKQHAAQNATVVYEVPLFPGYPNLIVTIRDTTTNNALTVGPGSQYFDPDTVSQVVCNMVGTLPGGVPLYGGSITAYCGGQSTGQPVTTGFQTDPALSARIDAIYQLVNILQRNLVPFGYIAGTVHAGLTGSASLTVSRLVGLKVALTILPAGEVQLPGNPPYLKDLGWISVSDGDGMLQERRVSQSGFVWLPPSMELATTVGYDFFPGVTATITELQPEP